MNTKIMRSLGWLVTGMAICLTASSCKTCRDAQSGTAGKNATAVSGIGEKASTQEFDLGGFPFAAVRKKIKDLILPEVSFRPPATIVDAVDFFMQASRDHDDPDLPPDQRGVNLMLRLPQRFDHVDDVPPGTSEGLPVINAMTARNISLYDALKLVCEVTGMKFVYFKDGVMIVPDYYDKGDMVRRSYRMDAIANTFSSMSEEEWKSFFSEMGVSWPQGSSLTFSKFLGTMRIRNTEEQLEHVELILDDLDYMSSLIHVEVQVVAFPAKDIEKLQLAEGVTKASLMKLWKAGKGKLQATAFAVTEAGKEAIVKATREVRYATEINVCEYGFEPQNFTVREVGAILQVIPEIEGVGFMRLSLNPKWVTLEGWDSFPVFKNLPFRQPVFGVTSFETQVTVQDGDTVLIGTISTPDGKGVHAGFLTVKRVNVRQPQRQP